jgi:predicted DCC family thiol-disulfide oxidoreductase YuxK
MLKQVISRIKYEIIPSPFSFVIGALFVLLSAAIIVGSRMFVSLHIGGARTLVLIAALAIFCFALLFWNWTKQVFVSYFTEASTPFNLALFRIIFFSYLLISFNFNETLWFSYFPSDLQFPPLGMKTLLHFIPVNPVWTLTAYFLFIISCCLALVGLFTRFNCLMTAFAAFYLLGIPELYGKVNHYHHLFWFTAIFAVSRSGDALSIDALKRSWKKADEKVFLADASSVAYSLPLRFIWILMGICYFFPGFWKLWDSGAEWILGDNLKYQMYYDWMGFNDWLPVCRIDSYPFLCHLSGALVIFFEMTFICFIFFRKGRYFAAAEGLLFHNLTHFLMKIGFYSLQICYVSLFNWEKIFSFIGKKLFKEEIIVLFDGNCSFCRKVIAALRTFDVFQRIKYLDIYSLESISLKEKHELSQEQLLEDFHGIIGQKILKGFAVYQAIAWRVPILWLCLPFIGLGKINNVGHSIYRNIADGRVCRIAGSSSAYAPVFSNKLLLLVGTILVVGNIIFGTQKIMNGWPFACYPTFSSIAKDRFMTIDCQVIDSGGSERPFTIYALGNTTKERISGLSTAIINLEDPNQRKEKFLALWRVISANDSNLGLVKKVKFYFIEKYTDPAKKFLNPIQRKVAFEFNPEAAALSSKRRIDDKTNT